MLKLDAKYFPAGLILLTFLMPTFPAFTRTDGAGRIGDMFLVAAIVVTIIIYFFIYNYRISTKTFVWSSLTGLVFVLLISISILFEIDAISVRDIYEYHKPLFILLVFYFFYTIDWHRSDLDGFILRPYIFLFYFFSIYALIEAFTGPIGNTLSTLLYKTNRPILYGKGTGSFGITYFFATFMLMTSFFFLFKCLLKKRSADLIWFFLSLLALLSSQSRTVFIALAFSFFYLFMTYWSFKELPHKKAIYLGVLGFVAVVLILWNPITNWVSERFPYLYYGIEYLIRRGVSADGAGSANIRFQQLMWAWENQSEIPVFGAGIGKATGPQLESFYALYLYRYGLIGICISLFLWIYNYVLSIRCYKLACQQKQINAAAYFLAFSVFCVALPITSLSSVITDQPRLAILFYGTTAVMLSYLRQAKSKNLQVTNQSIIHENSSPNISTRKI